MPRRPTRLPAALLLAPLALASCASDGPKRESVEHPGVELNRLEQARADAAIAQDLEVSGDLRGAILHYERARDADPQEFQWVAHRLAMLHREAGDPVAADIEFRRAWRLNPLDPQVVADWRAN